MKFLTQLNSGCVDICKNMLKSAESVGLNTDDFIIACLDKNAYEQMKEYKGAFLYYNIDLTDYQNWSFDPNSTFRTIVKNKWKLIKEIHSNHKNLCWVDTDIVFKENPLSFIENNSLILFQCDTPGSLICSGFMVFNDTEDCKKLINECGQNTEEDDQILINNVVLKYKSSCALLDQELFPNGYVYYKQNKKDKAIIIHNNHMVGIEEKTNKFKEEGLWFLKNKLEVKVISRIGSKRRNTIQKNLNSKNVQFSFFDAADKTNITRNNKSFYYKDIKLDLNTSMPFPDAFNNRKWLKIGEIGCFFSHYLLWLELVNGNKDAYLILEDDADPQFTDKEISKFLNNEKLDNVDMIICQSVSPNFPKGKPAFKNISDKLNIRLSNKVFDWATTEGTTGYIVTKSGAKKLLKTVETYQIFNPVDNFIGRCVGSGLNTYLCPNYLQVILNENVETEIHYDVPEQKVEYIDDIKFIIG